MKSNIFSEEFFDALQSSVIDIADAETLPPSCYTSPAFFEFEKDALFNREWLCLGRESWVTKPGDYFTSSIVGEPIVVVRTREGKVKAMSSVCQHRAMLVAEGSGNTRAFICPYHHWSYGLDGDLIGAPAMEKTCNFDKSKHGLPEFKVEIWEGFIFVNFDKDAEPLAPRLKDLSELIANYELSKAEGPKSDGGVHYPFNWKVMFENNNDGYHANKLHKGPLHDFVPSELATFPELPEDAAGYYRLNGTLHPDASFNATQKAILPIFSRLTDEERNRMAFANLPPTLSLVFTCDMVIYLILRADTAETHTMETGVLVAPGAMKSPSFEHRMAATMQAAQVIMAQDQHVDELVQVGLRSRFAPRGRYSWQEGAQLQFNRWLVPRYVAQWQAMHGKATTAPAD